LRELALHLLDIAENSVAAHAKTILISIDEDLAGDRLRLTIQDDGVGMDEQMIARVVDPFVTSRTTRKVGLGIPLLKAAAEACNGFFKITSEPGKGACVTVEFQHSHIDRMPLGDTAGTLLTLVVAYPNIRWLFNYRVGTAEFNFDSEPIKNELGDIPLTEPVVLAYIRELLYDGVAGIQPVMTR
jgi:hypothetical protein